MLPELILFCFKYFLKHLSRKKYFISCYIELMFRINILRKQIDK